MKYHTSVYSPKMVEKNGEKRQNGGSGNRNLSDSLIFYTPYAYVLILWKEKLVTVLKHAVFYELC